MPKGGRALPQIYWCEADELRGFWQRGTAALTEKRSHDKADKKTIVKDCMNRWKRNGKIK